VVAATRSLPKERLSPLDRKKNIDVGFLVIKFFFLGGGGGGGVLEEEKRMLQYLDIREIKQKEK